MIIAVTLAVIEGKKRGLVEDDFYDFLLWGSLSQKPVKEARLIGEILGKTQISVGDLWYAKRIDYFIGQGKIKVLEESENKYQRVISLA